ncbi:sigma-54-dependent Fis family transcriptional regulator [Flavobacterium sediminis]|uniref:Sigma-54-dependent Fis family transcriptional regulator n=1 Tax=Flavobacterium sediminis TaxID=2201181 RepID=A0A2U8QYR1_9FLAO|nr:sigma-54 dependent transcriptional regulator [Flavobacterium sediminis]AWM15303.1 sigma-54-dependent Fis family transcriptional regulator [Flavobacterium sediminis]
MKKIQANIVVIDDQEDILFAAKMLLKKHFETIITLNNPKDSIKVLSENKIDVVLLDMNYRIGYEDGKEGIYFLKEILLLSPATKVVLMTAFGHVETAVEALKLGAFDYILKPWDNSKLVEVVKKGVTQSRKEVKSTVSQSVNNFFIGQSNAIVKAYDLAQKVAKTDANILILGENGTGKYVLAHYIHQQSNRKDQAFIHVDLGSLNENIFESELFGYAKGAFTDAKNDTAGRFELAENGTIFLDEIGNVPLTLQAKLLQAIQTKTITRLGEAKPRKLNVRIIAATNLDLKTEVQHKNFREDLFYRLNTMQITLPSLRERSDDLVDLANFLLEKLSAKYDKYNLLFDEKALAQIKKHAWFGNIREMENRIERAVILCENESITVADLDLESIEVFETEKDEIQLSDIEKISIEKVLQKHQFNISKSAEELGLSRAALYRRMEKYQIKND